MDHTLFIGTDRILCRKGRAMLDAIFIVLGVVIFAAACGYAALCDRM